MNREKNHLKCFTIGHSNYDIQTFMDLLKKFEVNCLVDVRFHIVSIPHNSIRNN